LESTHLKSCKRHANGDLEQGVHEFLLLSAETPEVIFNLNRKVFVLFVILKIEMFRKEMSG
jgi:hypothetical protein